MTSPKKQPEEFAADAAKASEAGDHREAERLYLLAAARASAFTNQPTMKKHAATWDRNATRERRLAEIDKPQPKVPGPHEKAEPFCDGEPRGDERWGG